MSVHPRGGGVDLSEGTHGSRFSGETDILESLGTVLVAIAFLALLVVVGSAF
jgi:hypothetical protein